MPLDAAQHRSKEIQVPFRIGEQHLNPRIDEFFFRVGEVVIARHMFLQEIIEAQDELILQLSRVLQLLDEHVTIHMPP